MKKLLLCIICICMMSVYGCRESAATNVSDDYLSSLQENYSKTDTKDADDNEAEELFPVLSSANGKMYITDMDNQVIDLKILEYTGERMKYKLITNIYQEKEDGPQKFNRVFFILVNGYLQPFYFDNSEEAVLYKSISAESSSELSDYVFSFDPICVPFDENAALSFVIASAPQYYQEKSTEIVYSDIRICNYCLTAYSSECVVDYEEIKLPININTDFIATDNVSNGVFMLTEKLESAEQLNINTLLNTDSQLYTSIIGSKLLGAKRKNVRLYCVIDGELAPVFNDNYHVDLSVESMKAYQIPLDMEKLMINEKQQVYFIEIDRDVIEEFRNIGEENYILEPVSTMGQFVYCVTREGGK